METTIKTRQDVKNFIKNKIEKTGLRFTTGQYYKSGYGCHHFIRIDENCKFWYNYRDNGSHYLNDVELTEKELEDFIWEYRKYINYELKNEN